MYIGWHTVLPKKTKQKYCAYKRKKKECSLKKKSDLEDYTGDEYICIESSRLYKSGSVTHTQAHKYYYRSIYHGDSMRTDNSGIWYPGVMKKRKRK